MRNTLLAPRLACATALSVLALVGSARATAISLKIVSPDAAARTAVPVTSGVPIATADTASSVRWALFDDSTGTEIPLQTTLLPGPHTPWLLLDFRATVSPAATRTYTVKTQTPAAALPDSLVITGDGQPLSTPYNIKTGKISVYVSRDTFNLFREVRTTKDGQGNYPSSGRVVYDSLADNFPLTTADQVGWRSRHATSSMIWEDRGKLRATLRVDGYYSSTATSTDTLLQFTTRMTFYAGQAYVDVTHLIRSSFHSQAKFVKVKSAQVLTHSSLLPWPVDKHLRVAFSGDKLWMRDSTGSASVELISPTFTSIDSNGVKTVVTSDSNGPNGGMVMADWSYHGATARFDFEPVANSPALANDDSLRFQNRLFALAGADWYSARGAFGAENFGTWDDEKTATETQWGWSSPNHYTPAYDTCSTEHHVPLPNPGYYPSWGTVNATNDLEADELWSHLLMYARVQQRGFLERADRWARYNKWEFAWRTDGFTYENNGYWTTAYRPGLPRAQVLYPSAQFTTADNNFVKYTATSSDSNTKSLGGKGEGTHSWNNGLVDYYYMTGDRDALAAAVDIGEQNRIPGVLRPQNDMEGQNCRYDARAYLSALKLWEAIGSAYWSSTVDSLRRRLIYANSYDTRGFYYTATSTMTFCPCDNATCAAVGTIAQRWPGGKYVSPFQIGVVGQALYRGWVLHPTDDTVRTRLLAIASFADNYGANVDSMFTGDDMVMDYPSAGKVQHLSYHFFRCGVVDSLSYPWYPNPAASHNFIDALVIGNRLSANSCYLTRAKNLWSHTTKWSMFGWRYADDSHVGHFASSLQCAGDQQALIYPNSGGDLTYTQLFFHDVNGASFDLQPQAAVVDLGAVSTQGNVLVTWTAPADDGSSGSAATGYDVRMSTQSIDLNNFSAATSLTAPSPPSAPGTIECILLSGLNVGTRYYFRLKTRDECEWSGISNLTSVVVKSTGNQLACGNGLIATQEPDPNVPLTVEFSPRGANPASGAAMFAIGIPYARAGEHVELAIYDLAGRRIKSLRDETARPGRFTSVWDLSNSRGGRVHAGAYFVNFRLGGESRVKRLIIVN